MNKNVVESTEHNHFRFGSETNHPFSECTLSKTGYPSQKCSFNVNLQKSENKCERKSLTGANKTCQFDLAFLNESGKLMHC